MGQLGGCVTSNKQSEVRVELDMMKKLNEELYQVYGLLEARLSGVLRCIPPSNPCEENKLISLTPIATELREENKKISTMISLIQGLRDRVEL